MVKKIVYDLFPLLNLQAFANDNGIRPPGPDFDPLNAPSIRFERVDGVIRNHVFFYRNQSPLTVAVTVHNHGRADAVGAFLNLYRFKSDPAAGSGSNHELIHGPSPLPVVPAKGSIVFKVLLNHPVYPPGQYRVDFCCCVVDLVSLLRAPGKLLSYDSRVTPLAASNYLISGIA